MATLNIFHRCINEGFNKHGTMRRANLTLKITRLKINFRRTPDIYITLYRIEPSRKLFKTLASK